MPDEKGSDELLREIDPHYEAEVVADREQEPVPEEDLSGFDEGEQSYLDDEDFNVLEEEE